MILQGDCLALLKTIPDNSIDAVITDPPYGMDYQSNMKVDKSKRFVKIANDKFPFIWFLHDAFRVLKDGGSIVSFTDWKNQDAWKFAIECAGFSLKSQVVWHKGGGGMGDLSASFLPQHELAWFAVKGKYRFPNKRPLSVIKSQKVAPGNLSHPNEKPVDLMKELIASLVPAGGTILDPFVGSGATGVAAKELGFNFIGCELNPKYVAIAEKRIEQAQEVSA